MEKLKVLDLFSGIGGFSLGLERAGMETVAFCEIDEHCHKVLNKHWPDIPIHSDVKKLKGKNFKNVDVICGGFPCQDISVAGQKKGFKHDGKRTRSGLWEEFKRIIKEVEPRYAIIENVANLRNIGLNQVIKDLWSIGYGCEWHIISARSVGACHLRERLWIIAYPKDIGRDRRNSEETERERCATRCCKGELKDSAGSDRSGILDVTNKKEGSDAGSLSEKRVFTDTSSEGPQGFDERRGGLEELYIERLPRVIGDVSGENATNPLRIRLEGSGSHGQSSGKKKNGDEKADNSFNDSSDSESLFTNSNMPRLWKPFASEEASFRWWAKATAGFRSGWEVESAICRVDDGLPRGLDKYRRERIKQLGNSVLPQIPELIGKMILDYEGGRNV